MLCLVKVVIQLFTWFSVIFNYYFYICIILFVFLDYVFSDCGTVSIGHEILQPP